MNFVENIRIAIFSIRSNLMRSLLTMLGIIIGVSSVIAIITVGDGGREFIINTLEDMGSSAVSVTVSSSASDGEKINRDDIRAIKNVEDVQSITPVNMAMGTCATDFAPNGFLFAIGGNADLQQIMKIPMEAGRFFNEEEYDSASPVCVLPPLGAMSLFGTTDCVGEYIDFHSNDHSVRLKVIGVSSVEGNKMASNMMEDSAYMDSMGGEMEAGGSAFVPCTVIDAIYGTTGVYDSVYIMATSDDKLDAVGNIAANILYSKHNNFGTDMYRVTNMATYIDMLDSIIHLLTTFIAGVSAISLVVGGIGVMNIMLVSVTERTREIGIRKALGAKTSTILLQFLTESIILCLIGGLIGLLLGVLGAGIVGHYMDIAISLKFSTVALAVGFSSAIGVFFGIYPARRAAKMLPIEALRRD